MRSIRNGLTRIYLSPYIRVHGVRVRRPRRAEPPRHLEPARLLRAVGPRDRETAADGAADRLQALARAARDRLRRVARRRAAAPLPDPTGAADGDRCLARPLSALLVDARRPVGAPPRSDGRHAARQERKETMSNRDKYAPGPAAAEVRKDGDKWTLVLVRELRHPPAKVWRALTEPEQLREWAPFDADRSLGTPGTTVRLTTVGAPVPHVTETTVK